VAVSPDGARIVTGSHDNTARVWDAKTFAELAVLKGHTDEVSSVAVSPDGARIVTGSHDNTARVWDLSAFGQALLEEAKIRTPRCLTPAERRRYFLAAMPPRWCAAMDKWPYDSIGGIVEGARLLNLHSADAEGEAKIIFASLLQRDAGSAKKIDEVWANAYIVRAVNLLKSGEDEEAKAQFALALQHNAGVAKEIDTLRAGAYVSRGEELLGSNKDEKAKTQFALALQHNAGVAKEIDTLWAGAYVSRGKELLGSNKDEEAKAQFALALQHNAGVAKEIDTLWAGAYVSRGKELLGSNKDEEAKAQFALALQHDSSAGIHNDIAWYWFLSKRPAAGLEDAEKAVAAAPKDEIILDTRGQIYLALGRLADAFADLDSAISKGNTSPGTYLGRGRCYEHNGNKDAAIADYRNVLKQDATDTFQQSAQASARERLSALGASVPDREAAPK
jgi:tetratricopeptide (TPR) repeat protein